jgi:hypothetical protein
MIWKKRSIFLLIGLFFLTTGCINPFAPRLTDSLSTGDLVVTSQKTPEDVLQNFKIAYTFQHSLLYSDVLDTTFIFSYYDPDEATSGQMVSWGREEDLLTTGRMFRHFQVMDLVWNETISESVGETISEMSLGFDLTLVDEKNSYRISGRATFVFKIGKDQKWRIQRWKDFSDI